MVETGISTSPETGKEFVVDATAWIVCNGEVAVFRDRRGSTEKGEVTIEPRLFNLPRISVFPPDDPQFVLASYLRQHFGAIKVGRKIWGKITGEVVQTYFIRFPAKILVYHCEVDSQQSLGFDQRRYGEVSWLSPQDLAKLPDAAEKTRLIARSILEKRKND